MLLFVLPFFGLPMIAAAYFGVRETPAVAAIAAALFVAGMGYLLLARRRLRTRHMRWMRAVVREKQMHQVTSTSARVVSRRHYLVLHVVEALSLGRDGVLEPELEKDGRFSTTTAIYEAVSAEQELWFALMPHDQAIYFMVDSQGALVPPHQESRHV